MSRRVVITGLGLISPLGNSPEELWDSITEGRSGVRRITSLPADALPVDVAAEAWNFEGKIDDFGPLEKMLKRNIRKGMKVMCREIAMGVAAAQLALEDCRLNADSRDPDRVGIVFGSDYIMTVPEEFTVAVQQCLDDDQQFCFDRWAEIGTPKVDPLWLLKFLPNMPASHIAIYNDLRGPNNSITLREASSNLAVAEAYTTIKRGAADAILAGATGTRVHPLRSLHVLLQEEVAQSNRPPEEVSRPFDRDRSGLVLGEGAACIMMEDLEHAEQRGAKILGEVVGYGSSTAMEPSGTPRCDTAIANVLRAALDTAGMGPESVGHIHAHGLSTCQGDIDESKAICEVFGKETPPVTALKGFTGNTGAGGGLIELMASLLAFEKNALPPILNCEQPDAECPIAVNRSLATSPGDSCLNVNVSPQGQASSVLIRRFG